MRGFLFLPSISPPQNRVHPINNRGAADTYTRQCSPTTCCGWFAYCQPDARHRAQLLSSDRFSGAFDGSLCLGRLGRRTVFVSADETTSHARPNHVRLRSIRGPSTPCTRPTASPAGSLLSNSGLLDRNYLATECVVGPKTGRAADRADQACSAPAASWLVHHDGTVDCCRLFGHASLSLRGTSRITSLLRLTGLNVTGYCR